MRGGGRVYARFVQKLVRHGVVEITHQPGICECGAFTVRKKDGAQRLVIDARPANFFFAKPPTTRLPGGAALASISSESEEGFFGGALDVKSFFYHLSLPRELRQFFHLPSLRAGSLHRLGLARYLPKDLVLYPRLQVIPMGWNHALDIAHNAFANIVADSLQTNVRDLLVDGQKPPNINSGIPIVYVDNFVFLATSILWLYR